MITSSVTALCSSELTTSAGLRLAAERSVNGNGTRTTLPRLKGVIDSIFLAVPVVRERALGYLRVDNRRFFVVHVDCIPLHSALRLFDAVRRKQDTVSGEII